MIILLAQQQQDNWPTAFENVGCIACFMIFLVFFVWVLSR